MMDLYSKNLVEIKDLYNSIPNVWPVNDKWHVYSKKYIHNYVYHYITQKSEKNIRILNAGSGGNTYNLVYPMIHIDVAEKKIENIPNSITTSIDETLPFESNYFDICICVGSVINYCNASKAIVEISRVLKNGASLVLEFESSRSFEFLFQKSYNKSRYQIIASYCNMEHLFWVYSKKYILNLLQKENFTITNVDHFHVLSSLINKIIKNENITSMFSAFDRLLHKVPVIKEFSSNIILTCIKT